MKKQILNFGVVISKKDQKQINGGFDFMDPCPCSSSYNDNGDGTCDYPALFPEGFYCSGKIQSGICCRG